MTINNSTIAIIFITAYTVHGVTTQARNQWVCSYASHLPPAYSTRLTLHAMTKYCAAVTQYS